MKVPNYAASLHALLWVSSTITDRPEAAFDQMPRLCEIRDDLAGWSCSPAARILLFAAMAIASRPCTQAAIYRYQEIARHARDVVRDDLFAVLRREVSACC